MEFFRHYAPIAYVSVSVVVVCVIRIPQIQPVEVGCVVAYAFRRAFAHFGIIVENLKVAGFVGIFFVVKVKAVYHVVYLEMAGFRLAHTESAVRLSVQLEYSAVFTSRFWSLAMRKIVG